MPNFATITLDISTTFNEMFFLHIASFQFIESLGCHKLHCWTFTYCQICTIFCLIEATDSKFQNLKNNVNINT